MMPIFFPDGISDLIAGYSLCCEYDQDYEIDDLSEAMVFI